MIIVVDARPFVKHLTGVGTFLQSFIRSLQKHKKNEIYILLPKSMDKSVDMFFEDNVHILQCPLLGIKSIPRFIWFFIQVPIMLWKIKPDIFFSPMTNIPIVFPKKTRTLVVVHDVVNMEYKHTMSWGNRIYNSLVFNHAVKKTDYLWANSNYTKEKIKEYFPIRKSSKIFVGDAADRALFRTLNLSVHEECNLKLKYGIKDKFILFVGSLEPRKNLSFLIQLMPELAKKGIQLLVVGGSGWKNTDLYALIESSNEIKTTTIFAGYVSNNELVKLYNIADCYVSTSLNEGFGMPQLEAMLCGCPVVTAHNSGMIEVVEGRGITIDGWNKQEWCVKIHEIVADKSKRDRSVVQGLYLYDWNVITKDIIKELLS